MKKKRPKYNLTPLFLEKLKNTPKDIQIAFKTRSKAFFKNPNDPKLNDHQLENKLRAYRTFNVKSQWCVIYSVRNGEIFFENIGTHSEFYEESSAPTSQ